ncbi:MAG TPA: hypothetical protein PK280_19480 [Planctomycetota bacterium]|nr:hypothetical protein [Planctomycetota bacterium]
MQKIAMLLGGCFLASATFLAGEAQAKRAAPAAEPVPPAAVPAQAERMAPPAADRIMVRPQPVEQVTEETKREVARLVADYFTTLQAASATPEDKARVDKLVRELASEDWATRENASRELVKLGRTALPALREAARSKDVEVATRAGDALKSVEAATAKPIFDALRKYPQTVWVVVQGQIDSTRDEWNKARDAAAAAEKAGRKDEAEKLGAEVRRLGGRISDLDRLYWIVQNYTRYDR